jgi:hypothetical protein
MVIGEALYENRNAALSIAFEDHFDQVCTAKLASPTLDSTLDVFGWHRVLASRLDSHAQADVGIRAATTGLCRDDDFFRDTREQLAANRILLAFTQADIVPFTMP